MKSKFPVFIIVLYSAVLAAGLAAAYAWPVWWDVQPFTRMFPQQTPFSYGPPRMMPGGMAGLCPCLGWYGGQTGPRLTIQQAVDVLERYVAGLGQNLRLHEVMEFQRNFYAVVVERDSGVGAFELLVNPYTGSVSPEPGPNMMWNTKYGMHFTMTGWSFSPTADMPITSEQAEQIAFNYLRNRFTELVEVEHPTRFYGYYTLDYMLDGRVHGMLSVNGYTGQVWYHGWHGQFIQEVELEEEH